MTTLLLIIFLIAGLAPQLVEAPQAFFATATFEQKQAIILFGGDMMFDRSIREAMIENGDDHVFSCIADTLKNADVVAANLEGPITAHDSLSMGSNVGDIDNTTFTFATSTAALLRRHNISIVNLGNNHIMNFSRDGLLQTKKWLDAAGVQYFGDPDVVEEDRVLRTAIGGIEFSFVNWSDWTPIREPTASNGAGQLNPVVEQIRKESESGRVTVVYTHWGDEYVEPSLKVRQLAHSFVDAGADIVIGSHPHVVLEHEVYRGRDIYYSLGNFVFDQYWNQAVSTGLLLKVEFNKDGVEKIEEIPIALSRDGRVCPVE